MENLSIIVYAATVADVILSDMKELILSIMFRCMMEATAASVN